ncbi:carbohydrate kinase [Lichenihabitans sp. PAMC28606]|uniref:FGGY-family carbohydrate kinase n=1 Tax=Lichenihabitans sp. PAMC28606 TaxID=2880932 RepID=UPI001D0A9708|nr:FGGY-family carbohydrate kinase [Lichenihabitans sp. PAMC28606]UDL96260.1 carbohydrate kinase [Lichenihabitans sp. PAMC28606]
MRRDIIIGIDAGTSVIKAIAFRSDGLQIAAFALPNIYGHIKGGGAEQDMLRTWNDTVACIRGLAELVPSLADRAAALAVTGQGDGTWLIDDDGVPTAPAMLWLDARASTIVDGLRGSEAERRVYEHTGTGLNSCLQSIQLLWLRRQRPDVLSASSTAFHCKDWLYFKLTGDRASDPSESLFTYGDVRTRLVDPEVLIALGLVDEARLIPPIVDGLRTLGRLSREAARETGLSLGLPIALGYVDIVAAALGAGIYDRDEPAGCTIMGSTGMHMRLVRTADDVRPSTDMTGYTIAFPLGASYIQLQSNMASTLNLDWIINFARGILHDQGVSVSREQFLQSVDVRVLGAEPGSLLYHPYISEAGERGPFVDSAARAQFMGLAEVHRYDDLLRAVMEGLAFAARDCYEAMGDIPREIRVTGGAARSQALKVILGAVLGADIRTSSREEAGAAGAAMTAAVALGLYSDMESCTDQWASPLLQAPTRPDSELASRYNRLFPTYVAARHSSAPVWHALKAAQATN